MTALTRPAVEPVAAPADDEMSHYFCCNKIVALCGFADDGIEWEPWTDAPEADDCPVCVAAHQLSPKFCRVCAP